MGIHSPVKSTKVKRQAKHFGGDLKREFPFDPDWLNLNHGSFGSIPNDIRARLRYYQDETEAHPDKFIRYDYPRLLDESRAAVADIINAPLETVVFVTNATDGVNTVFRNLAWSEDVKTVIITFSTVYEACANVADFMVDYFEGKVEHRSIPIAYPIEDEAILRAFRETVQHVEAEGKRARVCVFDVVSSRPGVVFPWVEMTALCKELGVLSVVDGAQGIGMVPLDLTAADPDFFVSNCHKWLHVPRGCAVFYVPLRNQHMLLTTLATSNSYVPKSSPLAASAPVNFVTNFSYVGTKDNSPYLCVKDAIAWRRDVLGGEDKIINYMKDLNKKGSRHVASVLGTEVLENSKGTLTDCAMANVALPIWIGQRGSNGREADAVVPAKDATKVFQWLGRTMVDEYKTFMSPFVLGDRFWVRISAQVYLDIKDYETAAQVLKELSERVGKRRH